MPPLPVISGKILIATLQKAGFMITRQRGSHVQLRHRDGRLATIPMHGNQDLPRGTLRGILRDIDLSPEDFIKLI
ncbi:MAG: type II toxin-antitoxin system HicA family toxin [Patescibacteria group bacterium]